MYYINTCDNDSSYELWHKRLDHMSEKCMRILEKKNVLYGVSDEKLRNCSHCLAGKQRRVSFMLSEPKRKSEVLGLVHSNVCGPMKTRSLGGVYYFMTLIDYYPFVRCKFLVMFGLFASLDSSCIPRLIIDLDDVYLCL